MQLMDLVAVQVNYNQPEGSQLFLDHNPGRFIYAMEMGTHRIIGGSVKYKKILFTLSVLQH